MAESGDFFPDIDDGVEVDSIDAAMPIDGSDYGARGGSVNVLPAKTKKGLKRSRAGYQGYLTKLYDETEVLMSDKANMELVNNKLKVVHAAFANYERAHIAYMQVLEDRREIEKATLEYENRFREKFEFQRRVKAWMEGDQLNAQVVAYDVHPNDSVSQQGSSSSSKSSRRSGSRTSSRISVKIKEAKAEKAVAELSQNTCDMFETEVLDCQRTLFIYQPEREAEGDRRNGNLSGGERELRETIETGISRRLKFSTPEEIEWKFNPPGASHMGGVWERVIRSRRWRQIQYLADVFWKRWLSEYLPTLQERQKWRKPSRNLAVGDLVLVADERVHRCQWPLGRIVEVHPGRDGLIRSAKVTTKSSTLTRPISKLCFLEQEKVPST
ncbi:hypothetical protein ACROYT_G033180 [Oculina patagonica]